MIKRSVTLGKSFEDENRCPPPAAEFRRRDRITSAHRFPVVKVLKHNFAQRGAADSNDEIFSAAVEEKHSDCICEKWNELFRLSGGRSSDESGLLFSPRKLSQGR